MIKTQDNFKIKTKSGVTYDMANNFDILVRKFSVSSLLPELQTEKVESRNGAVRMGKTWGPRKITAVCSYFDAVLLSDFTKTIMSDEEFYIICDALPDRHWLVEISQEWVPDRIGDYGEFALEFISHSSFAESVNTLTPSFTISSFQVSNAGDVEVNPCEQPFKITFSGESSNLTIRNDTTGDEWQYTGSTVAGDNVVLDGIRATKNGLSIFRDTNHKLINLAPGSNNFTVTGASGSYQISFEFRYYYK